MILSILLYFFTGAVAGLLSGLLGIGGGTVVVPALLFIFTSQHIPANYLMHFAAGTSLASMIVITGVSFRANLRHGYQAWPIYKRLFGGLMLGALAGPALADHLQTHTLKILFAIFALLIATKMFLRPISQVQRQLPGDLKMFVAAFVIGLSSGLLGIGGGALGIPFLTYYNLPMRQVVVVTALIGFTIAIVGTLGFVLAGFNEPGLPEFSTGYIYWPAWAGVASGSILFAPMGAELSGRLSGKWLKRIFAIFLVIVGVHLLL